MGQTVEETHGIPNGPRRQRCPQIYEALEVVISPEDGQTPPPPEEPGPGGGGDRGGLPPGSSEDTGSGSGASGGAVSILPDTGGVALDDLGVGALLIDPGLLARRLTR